MIPIRDHSKVETTPLFTYLLIMANILVFMYMFSMPSYALDSFVRVFALQPAEIARGMNLYTFVTSMFLHGGLFHIAGNMLFLKIFGDNLEDALGHFKYLLFYLFTGVAASLAQVFIDPTSNIPVLGASGAIAGLMGGYLVLFPDHRIDLLVVSFFGIFTTTVPAYTMLLYWFAFQLFIGVGSLAVETAGGGIAFFAHVGGFAMGAIILLLAKPFLEKRY